MIRKLFVIHRGPKHIADSVLTAQRTKRQTPLHSVFKIAIIFEISTSLKSATACRMHSFSSSSFALLQHCQQGEPTHPDQGIVVPNILPWNVLNTLELAQLMRNILQKEFNKRIYMKKVGVPFSSSTQPSPSVGVMPVAMPPRLNFYFYLQHVDGQFYASSRCR